MEAAIKDTLWKGIIEDLFSDFLCFFYAHAEEIFDMERGFEFLDKELAQLYPGEDIRHPKFVDKLVRVYKKNGAEEWLLIHIEVQGYRDKTFPRRMFTYFCRILDRFNKEVASLAIFTDNDRNYCPDKYEYESLDTYNMFRFKTYKIKGQDMALLESSGNPFAVAILTVLISLQKSEKTPEDLLLLSLDLGRRLLRKGFSKLTIKKLLHFLQTYVYFDNRENYRKFEEEIESITEKNKTMGITELATLLIKEEGVGIGMEKGIEKTKSALVTNLLLKTNHSLSEIADLAETTVDFVISVKNGLSS